MLNKKLLNYPALFIICLALMLSSCDTKSSDNSIINTDKFTGGLTISLPGEASNTKAVYINGVSDIVRYDISLTCDVLSYLNENTALPGETITFGNLYAGIYTLSITAFNDEDTAIFGGERSDIQVVPGLINPVTITLYDLIMDNQPGVTVPWVPGNLVATVISSTQVDLTWVDNSRIEQGYRVYKMVEPDYTFVLIDELNADTAAYSDMLYSPTDMRTWYRVCAYNDFGESEYAEVRFPDSIGARFDAPDAIFDQSVFEP